MKDLEADDHRIRRVRLEEEPGERRPRRARINRQPVLHVRRERNPEKARAAEKRWRMAHPPTSEQREARRQYRREWYLARRDEILARLAEKRAQNRKPRIVKTHCPSGHPFAGENLRIDPYAA